jgi:aminomethyltransferase
MNALDAGTTTPQLKQTPLHALHVALGARMVPFAGYNMPVQYPNGILKEHQHTRESAGLFDVSHMGQFLLRASAGTVAQAARALEQLVPADIVTLKPGRQRYSYFTNAQGGIGDDIMVANLGDAIMLVVNAALKEEDRMRLESGIPNDCSLEVLDRALLALQGPKAETVLARRCRLMSPTWCSWMWPSSPYLITPVSFLVPATQERTVSKSPCRSTALVFSPRPCSKAQMSCLLA